MKPTPSLPAERPSAGGVINADLLKQLQLLVHRIENPLAFQHAEDLQHRLAQAHAAIAKATA